MERTDNLRVEILDKADYLRQLISGEKCIDCVSTPLSVDVVENTVSDFSQFTFAEILSQINSNAIVWLMKIHD